MFVPSFLKRAPGGECEHLLSRWCLRSDHTSAHSAALSVGGVCEDGDESQRGTGRPHRGLQQDVLSAPHARPTPGPQAHQCRHGEYTVSVPLALHSHSHCLRTTVDSGALRLCL